tara:strand:+ start:1811 stop:1948 length:138 start_codon:yes stop_codon:yes gene_type:complete
MYGDSVDIDQERSNFINNSVKAKMSFQFAMEKYLDAGSLIRSLKD